jgi:nucleotide-binding universal stress UspA family protein
MAPRGRLGDACREREEKEISGTIICGVDGSADSQAALDVAAKLARGLATRLVLVHVVQLERVAYASAGYMGAWFTRPSPTDAASDEDVEAGERLLKRLALEAGLADAEKRIVVGLPSEGLADVADEEDAELIVVGSRGRGAFKGAFLGSVSTSLVGVARCPVLIVPPGATER